MFGDVVKMASEGCSSTRLRILGKRHDKGRALHETSKKKKKKEMRLSCGSSYIKT